MNAHHRVLLDGLRQKRRRRAHSQANDSYLSSGHHYYDVSVPARRALALSWLKDNRRIAHEDFLALLDSLFTGKSHEEKTLAAILLAYHHRSRVAVGPKQLDAWFDHLVGWAEIDSMVMFSADEVLARWGEWKRFIRGLSRDRNINRRRAALVLLTMPVRKSADPRLVELAFETIEALKSERDKMITKAISWLLRSLVQHHKDAVAGYIKQNNDSLPAVALRETARKIATGRK